MKCVDIFSGCGGMSLGLQQAKFDVVAAFDNWDKAVDIYRENFNHPIYKQDLSNTEESIDKIKKFNPDIIVGGPPCQDFSSAGKRDVTQGRASLTVNFAEIVTSVKPAWFVMENVEQVKKSAILKDVIDRFIESGYGLTAVILDASYCGVPQARKRFFLIGELGGCHNSLLGTIVKNLSEKPLTIRGYLGSKLDLDYYYRHPRNYSRRGVFSLDEPSPTIRGVNRPLPKGYQRHNGDPQDVELSDIRPLTTIERSYIQTFPESFKFSGTKTDLEQIIGNAVPVKLAEFIGRAIKQYIDGKSRDYSFNTDTNFSIPERTLKKEFTHQLLSFG
jgi:DNA (cytosine-5)-methyltransferase 1